MKNQPITNFGALIQRLSLVVAVLLALLPAEGSSAQTITAIINPANSLADTGTAINGSMGIATDDDGNVFVAGFLSNNAYKITPTGVITEIINPVNSLAETGTAIATPRHIATDVAGNVFVTGWHSTNVYKITPAGVITEIISPDISLAATGTAITASHGIATDADGNVFVTGFMSRNAYKITPTGVITEIISDTGYPKGIATDAAGNVFVANYGWGNVYKITPAGVITDIINRYSSLADTGTMIVNPWGIATDAAGNVFVTGYLSHNVYKVTPAGVITEIISTAISQSETGTLFNTPESIATDTAGNVFVQGKWSNNAYKITPAGVITEIINPVNSLADTGRAISHPPGIATDAAGNVFVTGHWSRNAYKITLVFDTDADGILDNDDNCPAIANADQANLDGDEFGDACDSVLSVSGAVATVTALMNDYGFNPGGSNLSKALAKFHATPPKPIGAVGHLNGFLGQVNNNGNNLSTAQKATLTAAVQAIIDAINGSQAEKRAAGSEAASSEVPETVVLTQNYPNPFNPQTTIGFGLPEASHVTLQVFDMMGRVVRVLVNGVLAEGMHEAVFDARSLPNGAYIYRLDTPAGTFSKSMILMK